MTLRIHPRERKVDIAESEIRRAISEQLDRFELSTWETIRVISAACNSILQGEARMGIRMERHGNFDKEGGLQ